MPNWCLNKLTVYGTSKEVHRFLARPFIAEEYVPSMSKKERLEKFQALPEKEKEKWANICCTKEEAADIYWFNKLNGHGWCVENWGTKWDWSAPVFYKKISEQKNVEAVYLTSFYTAWSPPIPVVLAAAKEFLLLEFHLYFEEPGVGFCGDLTCKNGELSSLDEYTLYNFENKDFN